MAITFEIFKPFNQLRYGFSDRHDGPMVLTGASDSDVVEQKNQEFYFKSLEIAIDRIVTAQQRHSANTAVVDESDAGKFIPGVDGIVTKQKNLYLKITGSDCFPLFFYDPKQGLVGIAHAGWRGITAGVVGSMLEKFIQQGSSVTNILVGIGPGIQQHHFEIKKDVLSNFSHWDDFVDRGADGKIFVDLQGIIKDQLVEAGVEIESIEASAVCTYCEGDAYFSFRRDKPERVQAMLGYIGMRA